MLTAQETFATVLFDRFNSEYYEILHKIREDLNISKYVDIDMEFTSYEDIEDEKNGIYSMPVDEGCRMQYMHFYYPSTSEFSKAYVLVNLTIAGIKKKYMMYLPDFKKGIIHAYKI